VTVGREKRVLNLNVPAANDFPRITYSESKAVLINAMEDLPAIAQSHETGKPHPMVAALSKLEKVDGGPRIVLDELVDDPGPASSPFPAAMAAAAVAIRAEPLSATVKKGVKLDPPTTMDDDDFLDRLMKERNPPKEVLNELNKLY
jgi:hypothetical protein